MTLTKTRVEKVRLQALIVLQLGGIHQRLVQPGEVFEWDEAVLPQAHIAVKVPITTPLGMATEDPRLLLQNRDGLPWTTKGHMQKSLRSSALAELL